ncbi:threonine--tRNA ligase, partial [Phormidesmis priestleyi ANT.L61.2]
MVQQPMSPQSSDNQAEKLEKMYLPRSSESENLQKIRHTASHVMAMAVQKLFPKAQVTIGPWIENGFYYDFDSPEPFTDKDLKAIQKEMVKIINRKIPVIREEVNRSEAESRIQKINEPYKLEILQDIKSEPITIY